MSKDKQAELQARYGESEQGHFRIVDTIGVPHPYCITPKHLQHCDSMVLDATSIAVAEQRGARCGMRGCQLPYAQHEQALLIECDVPLEGENETELRAYLLKCKDMAEADKYAGFAFVKSDKHK